MITTETMINALERAADAPDHRDGASKMLSAFCNLSPGQAAEFVEVVNSASGWSDAEAKLECAGAGVDALADKVTELEATLEHERAAARGARDELRRIREAAARYCWGLTGEDGDPPEESTEPGSTAEALVQFAIGRAREGDEVREMVNSPRTDEWFASVRQEAGHQVLRWGSDHDAGKRVEDWVSLFQYLIGKLVKAHWDGNRDKLLHHVVTVGAVALNMHKNLTGEDTRMRPGLDDRREIRPGVYQVTAPASGFASLGPAMITPDEDHPILPGVPGDRVVPRAWVNDNGEAVDLTVAELRAKLADPEGGIDGWRSSVLGRICKMPEVRRVPLSYDELDALLATDGDGWQESDRVRKIFHALRSRGLCEGEPVSKTDKET